jgi:type IV pilus assembly protein PilY1
MNRETDVAATWNGVGYEPRRKIRKWDKDEESRSLTFVELASGRILARLHGRNGDTVTVGVDGIKPSLVHDAPFDSPITGIPAAFPSAAGEPARQIYVGDYDGTMWRIDVSKSNPANWKAEIAWDAYSRSGSVHAFKNAWVGNGGAPTYDKRLSDVMGPPPSEVDAAELGQPIQTAPVISLDERGAPVVIFATGDQESFTTKSPGMVNFVVAFTDEIDATGKWSPRIDDGGLPSPGQPTRGVNIAFLNGARATGPLSLYDGQLIFSFFDPNVGGSCTAGSGGACAMAYTRRESQTSQRPIPFIDLNESTGAPNVDDICVTYTNQFVFGIAVNQVPSCGVSETTFNDPWLAGGYTAQTTSNAPGYQLVMHTGEGGAPEDPGGVTNSRRIALPTPRIASRISSWVTALE